LMLLVLRRDLCVCYLDPNTRRLEPTSILDFPQAKRHRVGGGGQ
jgi:hypothetical protein